MAYPTNPIYKLYKDQLTGEITSVYKSHVGFSSVSDQLQIPICEGNTDYQAYLKWVAEGNTAEAAD